jgi:hypothetical protein
MDALGEPYQRLARNNKVCLTQRMWHGGLAQACRRVGDGLVAPAQVGKAVKAAANFLDSTAASLSYILREHPGARLAVFGYIVLVHAYIYILTARMQRLATHWEMLAAAAATPPPGLAGHHR